MVMLQLALITEECTSIQQLSGLQMQQSRLHGWHVATVNG